MGSYRPSKSKSRPHGRSVLAVLVKSQPAKGRICCQSLPAVLVKSQPDEERSCCQSLPAVLVKSQPDEEEVVIKECRLRESRASLRKEIVIRACRLREARASLRKKELLSKSVGCVPSRPASLNKSVSVKNQSQNSVSKSIQYHLEIKKKR